ncbi:MAG: hypothetical protein ACNI3C_00460 [Candidatus Marinarcus sp.]|uniref:hypothetical protein n=1 Tax=Candidatus Marinarcus sp. TaxID=3100987 RepID=UPI003B00EC00
MIRFNIVIIVLFLLNILNSLASDEFVIYTQSKHSKGIQSVAISEDSSLLATASNDQTIRLWDMKSNNFIKQMKGYGLGLALGDIAINRKNNLAVSTSTDDKKMYLWDLKEGKIVRTLASNISSAHAIALSKSGQYLALLNNGVLYIYDLVSKEIILSKEVFSDTESYVQVGVFFNNKNNKILVYHSNDGIKMFSFNDNNIESLYEKEQLESLIGFSRFSRLSISDDFQYMAVSEITTHRYKKSLKPNIVIIDLFKQKKSRILKGAADNFSKMQFYPNSYYLWVETGHLTSSYQIEVYDVISGERTKKITESKLDGIASNGKFYVDTNNGLQVKGTLSGKLMKSFYPEISPIKDTILKGNNIYTLSKKGIVEKWSLNNVQKKAVYTNEKVHSFSSIPQSNLIVFRLYNKVLLYDVEKDTIVDTIINPIDKIIRSVFLVDHTLLCIGYDHYSIFYDLKLKKEIQRINIQTPFHIVKYNNDILLSNANGLLIFDLASKQLKSKKSSYNESVFKFDISLNGIIALPFGGDRVMLYDYKSNKTLYSMYKNYEVSKKKGISRFSKDGNYLSFVSGDNSIRIWDINNRNLIASLSGHSGIITSIASFDIDNYIISSSEDGSIIIYDGKNYKELVRLLSFDNEWVALTPEGYFTGSQNAAKYLLVRTGGLEVRDFSQFYDHFFRPDLVKLKLAGKDISKYTNGLTYEEALKNPPPNIKLTKLDNQAIVNSTFKNEDITLKKDKATLNFNVNEHDNGGIGLIKIYQEGKLIKTIGEGSVNKQAANVDTLLEQDNINDKMKLAQNDYLNKMSDTVTRSVDTPISEEDSVGEVKTSNIQNKEGEYTIELDLISGKNEIAIEAFNKTNTVTSYKETLTIISDTPKKEPKLYAIVAGVNEFQAPYVSNLKYSENDAKAIKEAIENEQGKKYKDIEIKYHVGVDVTKDKLIKSIEEVSKKARLDDTIIFYISTHGKAYKGKLLLVPQNNQNIQDWINFEDIFKNMQEVKALKQIFVLDTCESGKANDIVSSVYDSKASLLAKSSGVHMLLATTKGTFAFEHPDPKVKNGVFTYKILSKLKEKSTDKNKDSFISIIELSEKLKEPSNNEEYQYPIIRNVGGDILIRKVD